MVRTKATETTYAAGGRGLIQFVGRKRQPWF